MYYRINSEKLIRPPQKKSLKSQCLKITKIISFMTSFYAQKFVICVTILFQTFENRIVVKRDVFGGVQTLCIIIRYKKQLAIYYHSV